MESGVSSSARSHSFRSYRSFDAIVVVSMSTITEVSGSIPGCVSLNFLGIQGQRGPLTLQRSIRQLFDVRSSENRLRILKLSLMYSTLLTTRLLALSSNSNCPSACVRLIWNKYDHLSPSFETLRCTVHRPVDKNHISKYFLKSYLLLGILN